MANKDELRVSFMAEWKELTQQKPPKSYGILVYNAIYGVANVSEETRKNRLREIYNVWNYGVMNLIIWDEIKKLFPAAGEALQS